MKALLLNCGSVAASQLFEALGAEVISITREDYLRDGYAITMGRASEVLSDPLCAYYAHSGHGDATKFYWGKYERQVTSSFVERAIDCPISFAWLSSCDSMTNAGYPNSFAHALTCGFVEGGVAGYSGWSRLEKKYWQFMYRTRDWMFDYLKRGYPVYKAYLLAVNKSKKSGWDSSRAVKYLGDQSDSFRLRPQQEFPEEELVEPIEPEPIEPEPIERVAARIIRHSEHPDWEHLRKVRGEFSNIASIGDAKESLIIFENELGVAECEPIVWYADGEWRIGLGVGQRLVNDGEVVDPSKVYQYLVDIFAVGQIRYTVRCEGKLVYEWKGAHGGHHDYFNNAKTSVELFADDGCNSRHIVKHTVLWVWDAKSKKWLRGSTAYNVEDQSDEMRTCTEVSPPVQVWALRSTEDGDWGRCRYARSEIPEDNNNWSPYRYDRDNDGRITKREVMLALQDFFRREITKSQAMLVLKEYFRQ